MNSTSLCPVLGAPAVHWHCVKSFEAALGHATSVNETTGLSPKTSLWAMMSKWYEYPYWFVPLVIACQIACGHTQPYWKQTHPTAGHHTGLLLLGHKFVNMTMMDCPCIPPVPQVVHGASPVDVSW